MQARIIEDSLAISKLQEIGSSATTYIV
jgi:hypothetical protein